MLFFLLGSQVEYCTVLSLHMFGKKPFGIIDSYFWLYKESHSKPHYDLGSELIQ